MSITSKLLKTGFEGSKTRAITKKSLHIKEKGDFLKIFANISFTILINMSDFDVQIP